jgi:hypothetical protein
VSRTESKSTSETISDLRTVLVDYAKQETLDPLKNVGRYLKFGIPGAFLMSTGLFLLGMAGLRALQTETGTRFSGDLSFAPYLFVLVGLGIVIGLAVRAITKGRSPG